MTFRNTPMTAQEIDERGKYYCEGSVDFCIIGITDTFSQSTKKPMLEISLKLWDSNGKQGIIKDYITENANWKLRDMLESIGYLEDANEIELDFRKYERANGKGRIKYKKDETGKWKHQFSYVMPALKSDQRKESDPFNDEIEF